ncbi:MAG: aspartate/glutamate racemase family protein [Spirochaetota bacterium]
MSERTIDPAALFGAYMRVTGVPTLGDETARLGVADGALAESDALRGRTLGIINGASWTSLWSTYFGRLILPGVKLVNVGNEGVQLNFMAAHERGDPVPPQINIDLFASYAKDLAELCEIDAVIITCSTMNRSADSVRKAVRDRAIPVVQIDEAMMEAALDHGGRPLVVATHGPTVKNTQALLRETAERAGREVSYAGATVEEAFELLGRGDIDGHNEVIAGAIREARRREPIDSVILAQLSMSVFTFTFPDPETEFGVPVFTSGEAGFRKVRSILEGEA